MILKGRHVDVLKVIERLGLPVKADTGREILIDCMFHSDDGSNLSVNRERGVYHCWVCGRDDNRASGSLVHLVVVLRGITYTEAEEYVLRASSTISSTQLINDVRLLLHPAGRRTKLQEPIWDEVDRYYNPRHHYWRKQRGIDSWTATKFMLGYDEKKQHAIIPITEDGVPVALIRRRLSNKGNRYIYPSKDDGFFKNEYLFGLDKCYGTDTGLCIVEGPIDCLKVNQAGSNVVAVLGDYLSEMQSRKILEYDPDFLILMTDEDLGGEILASNIWEHFPMRNVYGVHLPNKRKDPGDCTTWEIWEAIEHKVHILTTYLPQAQQGLHERTSTT